MEAHQAPPSLGFSRQEHWSGLPCPSPIHESEKWKWSRSVVHNSLRPHGPQPTRFLHPWDFPGKSTGVGYRCLLHVVLLGGQFSSLVSLHHTAAFSVVDHFFLLCFLQMAYGIPFSLASPFILLAIPSEPSLQACSKLSISNSWRGLGLSLQASFTLCLRLPLVLATFTSTSNTLAYNVD